MLFGILPKLVKMVVRFKFHYQEQSAEESTQTNLQLYVKKLVIGPSKLLIKILMLRRNFAQLLGNENLISQFLNTTCLKGKCHLFAVLL